VIPDWMKKRTLLDGSEGTLSQFMDFVTSMSDDDITELSDITTYMRTWLEDESLILNTFYEDSTTKINRIGDDILLTKSHARMAEGIQKVVFDYLLNPTNGPKVMIGLFNTNEGFVDNPNYNILAYFQIEYDGEGNVVFDTRFRIDSYEYKPPEVQDVDHPPGGQKFDVAELVDFWGMTVEETDVDEECQISLLTLSLKPEELHSMDLLNWTQFPINLLGVSL
jgi:hypothetical protein